LAILEALESAARDLQKSALAWELGIQENLRPLTDDKTGETVAQLARVPMKVRASTIHEEEWLRLLSRLQGGNAGYFMTDGCMYERKPFVSGNSKMSAVDVQCGLSWLYVLPASGAPKTP
ncbi:MAG: hypothetical protein ACT6Q9_17245, partial [Polaromonas sp.]|uniref:hypothetical protein n=1 Tax=Polaromonas sp. TaxID=1869339 RepID=UPI0040372309